MSQPMYGQPVYGQPHSQAQPIQPQPMQAHPQGQPMHPQPMHPQPMHPQPMHPQPMHPQPMHPQPIHPIQGAPMHPQGQTMHHQGQPMHPQGQPMHPQPMHPQGQPMQPATSMAGQPPQYGQIPGHLQPQPMAPGQTIIVQAPSQQVMTMTPHTQASWNLAHATGVMMQQKVSLIEAISNGCCEVNNQYTFYDLKTGHPIMIAAEDSECCQRAFCSPLHEAKINFYETTDGRTKGNQVYTGYKPCKMPGIACMGCCRSEMFLYRGTVPNIGNLDDPAKHDALIGRSQSAMCGGYVSPMIETFDKGGVKNGEIQATGPCIGGLCCDSIFHLAKEDGSGGKGHITKKGASDLGDLAKEMFTDADTFEAEWSADATPEAKATIMANMVLLDFMFFEDDGACKISPQECHLKCCDCHFLGCIIPCKISFKQSKDDKE